MDSQINERVRVAENRAAEPPDKAGSAWELARATLEKYFHRNLNQVKWIFIVAVFVMLVGFGIVIYGVGLSVRPGVSAEPSRLAALSGIVTEFIGATFTWIYRSTMRKADEFMNILERINTAGMGVQILESISEHEKHLKDEAKAQVVELILRAQLKTSAQPPLSKQ